MYKLEKIGAEPSRIPFGFATESARSRSEAPVKRSFPPVGAIQRGLEILRAVSKFKVATVSDIHKHTGFPKPTIVRMLETLIFDGYVLRDNLCGGYRVTRKTKELHSGYEGISRLIEAVRPWAIDLTAQLRWPVAMGILDGDHIAVQFSTAPISPYAYNTVLGMHLDFDYTAMGRAYLAFCPEEEREKLIDRIVSRNGKALSSYAKARYRRVLMETRTLGYAVRGHRSDDRTSSVAMPIRNDGQVLAVLNISHFRSVLSPEAVKQKLAGPLSIAVAKIEQTLVHMSTCDDCFPMSEGTPYGSELIK